MTEVPSRVMEQIRSEYPTPQDNLTPVVFDESNHEWIGFDIVQRLNEAIQGNTVYNMLPGSEEGEVRISPSRIGPWEVLHWCHPSGSGSILVTLMRGAGKIPIASVSTDRANLTVKMYVSNNYPPQERVIALKRSDIGSVIEELVDFVQIYRVFPS